MNRFTKAYLIIHLPLLRVPERVKGFVDLLELLFITTCQEQTEQY